MAYRNNYYGRYKRHKRRIRRRTYVNNHRKSRAARRRYRRVKRRYRKNRRFRKGKGCLPRKLNVALTSASTFAHSDLPFFPTLCIGMKEVDNDQVPVCGGYHRLDFAVPVLPLTYFYTHGHHMMSLPNIYFLCNVFEADTYTLDRNRPVEIVTMKYPEIAEYQWYTRNYKFFRFKKVLLKIRLNEWYRDYKVVVDGNDFSNPAEYWASGEYSTNCGNYPVLYMRKFKAQFNMDELCHFVDTSDPASGFNISDILFNNANDKFSLEYEAYGQYLRADQPDIGDIYGDTNYRVRRVGRRGITIDITPNLRALKYQTPGNGTRFTMGKFQTCQNNEAYNLEYPGTITTNIYRYSLDFLPGDTEYIRKDYYYGYSDPNDVRLVNGNGYITRYGHAAYPFEEGGTAGEHFNFEDLLLEGGRGLLNIECYYLIEFSGNISDNSLASGMLTKVLKTNEKGTAEVTEDEFKAVEAEAVKMDDGADEEQVVEGETKTKQEEIN